MSGLLDLVVSNALTAGFLAALAWLASRHIRRPSLVHGLWVLALVKLITPPLVQLPVLPDWSELQARPGPTLVIVQSGEGRALGPEAAARPPLPDNTGSSSPRLTFDSASVPHLLAEPPSPDGVAASVPAIARARLLASVVLLLGALGVSATAAWRVHRFRRLLRHAHPAPDAVQQRASELSRRLGLDRVPPVRLLDARVPPMLWPSRRGPILLLPEGLLPGLLDEERDTLLVHELAHVRRRDHWVRGLELVVTVLFWWYPVTWWARRALRQAEERCCDEWVVQVLPGSARAYAEGLLKSLDFVASVPDPLPLGASGAGPVRDLEARLKEIVMSTRPRPRLKATTRLALAVVGILGLAVFPTRAQTPQPDDTPDERPKLAQTPPPPVVPPAPPAPEVAAVPVGAPDPARLAVVAPDPAPRPRPATTPSVVFAPAPVAVPSPVVVPDESPEGQETRRDIEARRRDLEAQRAKLQQRELEMERRQMERRARQEQEHLEAEIARMRADGEVERAALVERHAQAVARRAALRRQSLVIQEARMAEQAGFERAIHEALEKQQALEREGQEEAAAALRQRVNELEKARLHAELSNEERAMELRQESFEIERQAQQVEMELALATQERSREDMLARMESEESRLATEQAFREKERAAQRAAQELRVRELEIQQQEAAGHHARAEELRAEAERMRTEMDALQRGVQEEHLLQASSHLEQQIAGQLQALRDIEAEGAQDGAEVRKEITRLEAALNAMRQASESFQAP